MKTRFFIVGMFFLTCDSFALVSPSVSLRDQIYRHQGTDFSELSRSVQANPSKSSTETLLKIANDRKAPDQARYKAFSIALTLLPKTEVSKYALSMTKDPSWMLRSLALRKLVNSNPLLAGETAKGLLKDRAWVIRSQAIETLSELKPPGVKHALSLAAADPTNFHRGKAQWVAYRAFDTLLTLKPGKADLEGLSPVLARGEDRKYLKRIMSELNRLGYAKEFGKFQSYLSN